LSTPSHHSYLHSFPTRRSSDLVTKLGPLEAFYPAEPYHQDYLTLHPNQPYIAYNDLPKIENLKKLFAANYLDKPTLVSSAKVTRSEEHTSELQSRSDLVCRLLL